MADVYPHRMTNSRESDDFDCPECDWTGDNPSVLVGEATEWRCPECATLTPFDEDPLDEIAPDDSLRS